MALLVESFAKLNLFLEVGDRTSSGYHELSTVMQSISPADVLRIEEGDGIEVVCDDPSVPGGEGNTAFRAPSLRRVGVGGWAGCKISIQKKIPVEAGLGGGSGDAAAVLAGLARLWGLAVPLERLARIGAEIGTDVPFFLYGGTRLCEGRGEIVRPYPPVPASTRFLVVTPKERLRTSFVYKEFDTLALTGAGRSSNLMKVPDPEPGNVLRCLFNRLEEVVVPAFPSVRELLGRMEPLCPGGVRMSGSGPSLFGLLASTGVDQGELLSRFADCRFAAVAHPTFSGYRFLPPLSTGLSNEGGEQNGD
ncbi:MAG: 4-(cytidine 5'-diphospho)-2-C-methyl-D-erythritol kinase [Candidatus Eisenbacteria bacterium]